MLAGTTLDVHSAADKPIDETALSSEVLNIIKAPRAKKRKSI
jgi:hypothetical protein